MKKLLRRMFLTATICLSLGALIACGPVEGEISGSDSGTNSGSDSVAEQPEITLNAESLELTVGEEYNLFADYDAEGTPVWTSSDPSVAAVDENGTVSALKAGEAVISVSLGGAVDSCTVTVSDPVLSLHFYEEELEAKVSESYEVVLTCLNGEGKAVSWSVSDKNILKIISQENAVEGQSCTVTVEAIKAGSATLTATVDGIEADLKVSCTDKYELSFVGVEGAPSHLMAGQSYALDYEYVKNGEAGNGEEIEWAVSETEYASVDEEMLVLTDKTGTFSVTGSVGDVSVSLTFESYRGIETADDFAAMQENLNGYYVLLNDIDFAGAWVKTIAPYANTGASKDNAYMPQENEFNGIFDGNGYALKNFRPDSETNSQNALFGAVGEQGVVKNVSLLAVNGYLGGSSLVYWLEGHVENVYLEMSLVGTTTSITKNNPYAGIVTKMQINASLENCIAVIDCAAGHEYPAEKYGAIAGYVAATCTIDNCIAFVPYEWGVASLPTGGQSITDSAVYTSAGAFLEADFSAFEESGMWTLKDGQIPVLKNTDLQASLQTESTLSLTAGTEREIEADASGLYFISLAQPVEGVAVVGTKLLSVSDSVAADTQFVLNVTLFSDPSQTVSVVCTVSLPLEELAGTKYYDASEDSMTLSLSEAGIPAAVTEVKVEGITVTHASEGDILAVSGVYEALGLAENWNFGAKKMSVFAGGTEYTLDVIVVSKIIMQSDVTDDPTSLHSILYNDAYKSEGTNVTNWGGYYVLGENITFNANKMNEMPSWITRTGDRFNGTFDGRGYTISNYTAGQSGAMFTYLGVNAVIRNIHFVNAKIGNNRAGGLISVIAYPGALVENIYAEATIGAAGYSDSEAGSNGVLVRSNSGTIRNCITAVEDPCWKTDRHGYIASVSSGNIENCYAIVNYTGTDADGAAGIVTSLPNSTGDYSTSKVYESADAFFADEEVTGALKEKGYNDYWTFDADNKTISMNPAEE